jgi:hypothetical protein
MRCAAEAGGLEFGLDDTALVQEHLTPEGDTIVRVEYLVDARTGRP